MFELYPCRPTWTEINLDNLSHNLHTIRKIVGEQIKLMAVVKADAYGHGAIECARRLEKEKIDWLGVALPEEGLELRNAGLRKLILCLGGFWKGQENLLLNNQLTPVIFQTEKAELFNRAAKLHGTIADIHIKIDTGMGRIGVRFDEVGDFAEKLREYKNLNISGLMTHFASADDLRENEFTNLQIKRFYEALEIFREKGFHPIYRDLANSPASVAHPGSHGNMVRLGGVLYGLGDDVLPREIEKPPLKPVLSLHTRIAYLKLVPPGETIGYGRTFTTGKESLIATIPIGYQDGYSRLLSNSGRVIINGMSAGVVGRISMDWTILDVSNIPGVKIDDEVILIGSQNDLTVTAGELARKTGTISYEVTCRINRRVERRYVESQEKPVV